MEFIKKNKQHLKEAGKGYIPHLTFSCKKGFELIKDGIISILHGIIPSYKPFYNMEKIIKLYKEVKEIYTKKGIKID
jgi:hypothetical protein